MHHPLRARTKLARAMRTGLKWAFGFLGLIATHPPLPSPQTPSRIDPLQTTPEERGTFGIMGLWKALFLLTTCALPVSDAAKKLRRVKAGKHYTSHDPVHIVVNKVG